MKTILPAAINTIDEAKEFLKALYDNGEDYHPEDDAHEIEWGTDAPDYMECRQLNKLMCDIYNLEGNCGQHINLAFDPCEFLLCLNPEYLERMEADLLGDDPQDARKGFYNNNDY